MGTWIDYRQLRESLDFVQVLQHYRINFKRRGSQAQMSCPFSNHPKDGKSPSLSVSFEKRLFQCFGCGAKGNVLEFIALMEGLNPQISGEFRRAAVIAQERFMVAPVSSPGPTAPLKVGQSASAPVSAPRVVTPWPHSTRPVLINQPLDFELKNLDPKPRYLLNRGFTQATIAHFGLGYCSKGMFAGRVVIPLHDQRGRLIGYTGRIIYDDAIDEGNPKYIFPAKRERNGRTLDFAKSLFVYHGHVIRPPVHDLVVVQGIPAAWWLWQNGYQDVVALMGDSCSTDQAKIIVSLLSRSGRMWFLTDANKDGGRCAESLFREITPHRFCKWVRLPHGQPTDHDRRVLDKLLEWKIDA